MAKRKARGARRASAKSSRRAAGPRSAKRRAAARSRTARRTPARKKTVKAAARKSRKAPAAKRARASATKKAAPKRSTTPAARKSAASSTPPPTPRAARAPQRRAPTLDRERRTVDEVVPMPPSTLNSDRSASAARSGRAELAEKVRNHTSTGPAMTAGDLDADWESAESVGDEAPGGDNPTPDQDVVDEIGRALGVEYDDDEELRGGDEIIERDRNRWELDPASSDDYDDREE
jgi:Family of unknown function (DUF6335)